MDMIKEATHIARNAAERSATAAKGAKGEFLTFRLGGRLRRERRLGIVLISRAEPRRARPAPFFLPARRQKSHFIPPGIRR